MVEFALVVPILFLMVFGIVDFSRGFYTMSSLTAAVRDGARFAATLPDPCAGEDRVNDVVLKHFTPFGSPPLLPEQVHVAAIGCAGAPCLDDTILEEEDVAVCVEAYGFNPVTPVMRGSVPMSPRAVFRREGM